jgi:hypothetical protein
MARERQPQQKRKEIRVAAWVFERQRGVIGLCGDAEGHVCVWGADQALRTSFWERERAAKSRGGREGLREGS